MKPIFCNVGISTSDPGGVPGTLAELVASEVAREAPLLAWAEPDPLAVDVAGHRGRRTDFVPLQLGAPRWPTDVPLLEVRLFWQDSSLHAVALEGSGCRWVRLQEPAVEATARSVMRHDFDVYTLRDLQRFGIEQTDELPIKVNVIEYRVGGRLIGWRLIPSGSA